ncbi:hypothetical protein K1719_025001 [Acacia pycnantha]|nr:hypothetical protein K1719_025001 [Acacia pycnantha]
MEKFSDVVNWIKSNVVMGENLPLSIKSQAAKKSFPEVVSKENNIFGQKTVIPPVSTAKILQFHGTLLECSPTIKPLFSVFHLENLNLWPVCCISFWRYLLLQ